MDVVTDPYAPVVKVVTVPVPATEAFRAFTQGLDTWWPFTTHSTAGGRRGTVAFGTDAGQHVVEIHPDGRREVWGTLTRWAPPELLTMTWHPGGDPARATELEVRFAETSDGTRVHLRHVGWEARDDGAAARADYDTGWDTVLGHYVDSLS